MTDNVRQITWRISHLEDGDKFVTLIKNVTVPDSGTRLMWQAHVDVVTAPAETPLDGTTLLGFLSSRRDVGNFNLDPISLFVVYEKAG